MGYYILKGNARRKNLGAYPQIIKYLHNCNVKTEENFIDNFFLKRLPQDCIVSDVMLDKKSYLTHFLNNAGSIGFKGALIVNKDIIDLWSNYRIKSIEFQEIKVFQESSIHFYYVTHPYYLDHSMIDFEKSEFMLIQRDYPPKIKKIKIKDLNDFQLKSEKFNGSVDNTIFQMTRLFVNDQFSEYDLFIMNKMGSGINYVVSERLKTAMEKVGVTSMNYRPTEITEQEWMADSNERFQRYGTR